jgi:hypothetical protein
MIPEMQSLDFASIENVLQIIGDGIAEYHVSHGKGTEEDQGTAVGQTIELYVKLKLKKTNIELMMKNACDQFSE